MCYNAVPIEDSGAMLFSRIVVWYNFFSKGSIRRAILRITISLSVLWYSTWSVSNAGNGEAAGFTVR